MKKNPFVISVIATGALVFAGTVALDDSQRDVSTTGTVTRVQHASKGDNATRFTLDTEPGRIYTCRLIDACKLLDVGDSVNVTFNEPSVWNTQTFDVQAVTFRD